MLFFMASCWVNLDPVFILTDFKNTSQKENILWSNVDSSCYLISVVEDNGAIVQQGNLLFVYKNELGDTFYYKLDNIDNSASWILSNRVIKNGNFIYFCRNCSDDGNKVRLEFDLKNLCEQAHTNINQIGNPKIRKTPIPIDD